ncbi:MAG: Hpt domain-containing protein [Pseudomonadota bacterium]
MSLLGKFAQNYKNFEQQFIQLLAHIDNHKPESSDATRLAHTLKSVAANIGATELQLACKQLEQECKIGNPDLSSQIMTVNEKLIPVLASIQSLNLIKQSKISPLSNKSDDELKIELEQLVNKIYLSLLDDNTAAIKEVEQLILYEKQLKNTEQLKQLTEIITEYDFEGAIEIITEIADTNIITLTAS